MFLEESVTTVMNFTAVSKLVRCHVALQDAADTTDCQNTPSLENPRYKRTATISLQCKTLRQTADYVRGTPVRTLSEARLSARK